MHVYRFDISSAPRVCTSVLFIVIMDRLSLFSPVTDEEVDDFNPLTTINLFIKYVDYLVTIGLEVRSSLFV